jgi:hypothetical protein
MAVMATIVSAGDSHDPAPGKPPWLGQIGYIFGTDSQHGLIPPGTHGVPSYGGTDLWQLRWGDPADFLRIHMPANFHRLRVKPPIDRADRILNLVTDPDLNPIVLGHAEKFLRGYRGRVINHPSAVLQSTRADIARLLDGIDGLVVPKVARFRGRPNLALAEVERQELRFPAILRLVGTHGGEVVGVLPDRDALVAAIKPDATYYLTEFVESRAARQPYHKIRVFFLGDDPIIRHRLISDRWNIHASDRKRVLVHCPDEIATERVLMDGGAALLPRPVRTVLAAIRARMQLDFFGIDFAVMPDQRLLLFEANATMSFFPVVDEAPFDYFAPMRERAAQAFNKLLAA